MSASNFTAAKAFWDEKFGDSTDTDHHRTYGLSVLILFVLLIHSHQYYRNPPVGNI